MVIEKTHFSVILLKERGCLVVKEEEAEADEVMMYHFIAKKIVALKICFFADGTPKTGY